MITGRGSTTGDLMLAHPGFRKLAFTGSTEVGYTVARAAADRLIPATLELGGKSANIFFPDCPWEKAVEGVQLGILLNQGQVCCAGSRVFVHRDIYDRFLGACAEAFRKVKVGLPWEPDTQMGCQINEAQLQKIANLCKKAKRPVICFGGGVVSARSSPTSHSLTSSAAVTSAIAIPSHPLASPGVTVRPVT